MRIDENNKTFIKSMHIERIHIFTSCYPLSFYFLNPLLPQFLNSAFTQLFIPQFINPTTPQPLFPYSV